MNISLIGLGSVGSLTLQYLVQKQLGQIFLHNRNQEKAEGIRLDTVSAFPELHSSLHVGNKEDLEKSDIVVVTAGPTALPNQSFADLTLSSLSMVQAIFEDVTLNTNAVVIFTTTPVDEVAEYFQQLTNHPKNKVIGFGGSLDESRLRYLLAKETSKDASALDCCFVGIHGGRGLPIIREKVRDTEKIANATKNYFKSVASKTGGSTIYGPAWKLAQLIEAVSSDTMQIMNISGWDDSYQMFVTYPFEVGNFHVVGKKDIKLSEKEKKQLDDLLVEDKSRRVELFSAV